MIHVDIDYDELALKIAEQLEASVSPWMTVTEAAEYLRASERWVRGRLHEIPHSKVDGKTLLHRRELDSWLTNHRRES